MAKEFIFVYGTLRRPALNRVSRAFWKSCEFFSTGSIQARLYEIDGYPGAIPSEHPNDKVYGEILQTDHAAPVFTLLDDYEECSGKYPIPHEYSRRQVPISVACDGQLTAWAYFYNHDVINLEIIPSGDYFSYIKRRLR